MATRGGAVNLGRGEVLGQVAPGFAADVVGFKYEGKVAYAGAGVDPVASLLLCAPTSGVVNWSIIDGHVVVKEGVLMAADLGQGEGADAGEREFDVAAMCAAADKFCGELTAGVAEASLGKQ